MDSAYNCTLRVLVVDADPLRRDRLIGKLRQRFQDVFAAEGQGPQLLEDAQHKVLALRCHAAVVVPALAEAAGWEVELDRLAVWLAPAGIVICALRPDDRLAFLAGRRGMEYVRYNDPPSDLCAAVEACGRQGCRCQLRVSWPHEDFAATVAQKLKKQPDEVRLEHLHDLVGRIFPQAESVELTLLETLRGTALIGPAVWRAVVLLASERLPLTEARRIPKVLKIGPGEEIAREVRNYRRYVDGWLLQNRQAWLERHARLWHLGAVTYAFLGVSPQEMVPFRQFYLHSQAPEVLEVLRQLFTETCRNWYQKEERQHIEGVRLFELYDEPLRLQKRMEDRLDTASAALTFPGIPRPLPNPALWALDVGRRSVSEHITTCITHGDLHSDNFFVDRSRQAWLIDFEHTGPSHALRDFVELEADLKLRLTAVSPVDLSALAALEHSLLLGEALTDGLIPAAAVAGSPHLLKAFQVVAGLRHLAHIATGVTSLREYQHTLLYETLFMATLSRLHPHVRERALCSAALIAEHLRNGAGPPPAREALPRLELDALPRQPQPEAAARLEAYQSYLRICQQSLEIQQSVYNGQPPPELQEDIQHILAEERRAGEALHALR